MSHRSRTASNLCTQRTDAGWEDDRRRVLDPPWKRGGGGEASETAPDRGQALYAHSLGFDGPIDRFRPHRLGDLLPGQPLNQI